MAKLLLSCLASNLAVVMSIFGSIFGSGSKKAPADTPSVDREDQALIRTDIGRLDKVRPGLGEQVVDYICRGENDSVLLTLSQLKKEASEILKQRGWSSAGHWEAGRADFLLGANVWRPDIVRRYGEVLAPLYEGNRWPALPGSERSPGWFRVLLNQYGEARRTILGNTTWKKEPSPRAKEPWPITKLVDLLGEDLVPILDTAFERDENSWRGRTPEPGSPEHMPGFLEHLSVDPARRVSEMRKLTAKSRAYGLRTLARLKLTDGEYFTFAFEQAGDTAKSAREAASLVLRSTHPDVLAEKTRMSWPTLKTPQKLEIARIVSAVCSNASPDLLRQFLESEKNETVRAEISRLLGQDRLTVTTKRAQSDGADGYTALSGEWIAAPTPVALPADIPVSPSLRQCIDEAFAAWRADDERYNREQRGEKYFRERNPLPSSATDRFCTLVGPEGEKIQRSGRDQQILNIFHMWGGLSKERAALEARIFSHPELTLWHLLRAIAAHRGRLSRVSAVFWATKTSVALRARVISGGLRTYCDACAALGDPQDDCMRFLLEHSYLSPDFDEWPRELLWPYFARHFALIDEALGLAAPSSEAKLSETLALDMLALFEKTPARYFPALLDRASGDRKLVRTPARNLLSATPALGDLLVPLLKHPKAETRAGVATWLADRGETAAIELMLEAVRKEKLPAPKAALLGAIARLGGDIAPFVSAGSLLSEAEEGLKKNAPKGLEWFPFDGMPLLRQTGGEQLDPKVLRWWIVLAAKLKQPGGNPWFELLLDELESADAAKVGLAVMSAWIAYDTAAPSEAEANAFAAQRVDATLQQYKKWQPDTTREKIFSMLRQQKLGEYFNSGNDQKGVLALAARASGPDVVNMARAYFRDHYMRTAQCKALLECLAANPSPVAIQFVLSIAKRWRTKGVQELAAELVTGIADRRGWTSDQLADRTIPTGGFDHDGRITLEVGDKTYTARLDSSGKITLFNPEGRAVQGLPAAAGDDVAAVTLKASKTELANARKEVKQVLEFQSQRLYEALCVERDWPASDWSEFLLQHPLMRRLVQRLVWLGFDASGKRTAVFRPMEDLTLTDASDTMVSLDGLARVRLAHRTALSADEQAAWQAHLKDYEVSPLFDQFGRTPLTVDALLGESSEIVDRKGWLIEAFRLRGAATKLGYTRGQAEDGGWFYTYQKSFDALGLVAVVEFTGNGLPEENRTSALVALRFSKLQRGGLHWHTGVPLKTVPSVLLSEAWNDFHDMAAVGTGFDTTWEKKVAW